MTKPLPNSRRAQRGAIGLLGVVVLLLAVLFTALVVDSGRLWMQQRQLQTVADIASIQAARQLGCDGSASLANVQQAAQQAAAANGYTGNLLSSPNIVDLVNVTTVNGIRQFTTGGSGAEPKPLTFETVWQGEPWVQIRGRQSETPCCRGCFGIYPDHAPRCRHRVPDAAPGGQG